MYTVAQFTLCIRMRSGLDEQKYDIIQQEAKAISKTFQQRTLEAHQLYLLLK